MDKWEAASPSGTSEARCAGARRCGSEGERDRTAERVDDDPRERSRDRQAVGAKSRINASLLGLTTASLPLSGRAGDA